MIQLHLFVVTALCVASQLSASPAVTTTRQAATKAGTVLTGVKTTAYTDTETDHVKYGSKSAVGTDLKYGRVRSAAADWSIYPVGTQFRIEGEPYLYEVDDYGSALVGTRTIDLYKPSRSAMNQWGARQVDLVIVRWGSFQRSLEIMKPREQKLPHIHTMVARIEGQQRPSTATICWQTPDVIDSLSMPLFGDQSPTRSHSLDSYDPNSFDQQFEAIGLDSEEIFRSEGL
jgi:3D (Asp-Asp-Asp) domain-containing protein